MKTPFKKLIKTLGKKTMDDIIKEVSKYPIVSLKSRKKLTTKKMIIEILNQYETMTCADILYHIVNGYKIKTTTGNVSARLYELVKDGFIKRKPEYGPLKGYGYTLINNHCNLNLIKCHICGKIPALMCYDVPLCIACGCKHSKNIGKNVILFRRWFKKFLVDNGPLIQLVKK